MRETRVCDEYQLFSARQAHAFTENGEVQVFNAGEQGAISMHEQPQSRAAFLIDESQKRRALFVALPGAIGFKAQKLADAQSAFGAAEIFRGNMEARDIFFGQVDPAERAVDERVANNKGQLEGQTCV